MSKEQLWGHLKTNQESGIISRSLIETIPYNIINVGGTNSTYYLVKKALSTRSPRNTPNKARRNYGILNISASEASYPVLSAFATKRPPFHTAP